MIHDLDEALRQLLIRDMPIKNGEVDISFDQPSREWSGRLSRPTLSVFLYDVRENAKLRQARPMWEVERRSDGTAVQRPRAVRIDLRYMISAWANDPADEHELLTRALLALFRTPELPEDLLPERLMNQPAPIAIMAAQEDAFQNPTDVWNVLDNELRPVVSCVVTMALDPYEPLTTPLLQRIEWRTGQASWPQRRALDAPERADTFWSIGGTIHTADKLQELRARLLERDVAVIVRRLERSDGWGEADPERDWRFAVGRLSAGEYTLEITADGGEPTRHAITVPSPDYEIEV